MQIIIFSGILFIQAILSLLIWPSFLLPNMNIFSALAVFLLPIPCLVMVQLYSGKRLFVLFGLSHVACFLPAAVLLLQMNYFPWVGVIIWMMVGLSTFAIAGLTGVWGRWIIRRMPWAMVFVAPALMLFVEYLMLILSQIFILIPPPETLYAYPLVAIPPLIQIASYTGVLGASALVAFVATGAAIYIRIKIMSKPGWQEWLHIDTDVVPYSAQDQKRVLGSIIGLGAVLLFLVVMGNVQALQVEKLQNQSERSVKVAMLQAQFDPTAAKQWNRTTEDISLRIFGEMIQEAKTKEAEVLLFTENAFPMVIPRSKRFWDDVRELIRDVKIPAFIGVITEVEKDKSLNMWYHLNAEGIIQGHYIKQSLAPFGEYLPLRQLIDPMVKKLNMLFHTTFAFLKLTAVGHDSSDLIHGKENKLFSLDAGNIFLTVCNEVKYPQYFRQGVLLGGEAALAPNSANWFQQPQYFSRRMQMTAFRAVENRRWVGYLESMSRSSCVDALGIVRHISPFGVRSVNVQIIPMLTTQTMYTRWGDWFPWSWIMILFGFSVAALILARRK